MWNTIYKQCISINLIKCNIRKSEQTSPNLNPNDISLSVKINVELKLKRFYILPYECSNYESI